MKDIEILRSRFLADDVDPEDREENERLLREWEEGLSHNSAYLEWQSNDITKEIAKQMKESYKEFAMILSSNRSLTQEQRMSLWAKQDACVFILSLTERDSKGQIEQIQKEIKRAVSVT